MGPWVSIPFRLLLVFVCATEFSLAQDKKYLGEFSRPGGNQHNVKGKVYAISNKTFRLENFYYDGLGPQAWFWVGSGANINAESVNKGRKIPDENGKLDVLKAYTGKTIELTLPEDLTMSDVDWLTIWCVKFSVYFARVWTKPDMSSPVPPNVGTHIDYYWIYTRHRTRMFRIESYISPFIFGYIDKYIQLKPEDFQVSLWGGDVALYNLDLRVDAFKELFHLPIEIKTGHIHELRIRIPWTRLNSESVEICINTLECVLRLSTTKHVESQVIRTKKLKPSGSQAQLGDENMPPGYVKGLINKITSNIKLRAQNMILKFVEDNIVMSINIKQADFYSVGTDWNWRFVEMDPTELALRRKVTLTDITLCLDSQGASGQIASYEHPVLYRASVEIRLYFHYNSTHSAFAFVTKINCYAKDIHLTFSSSQLPLFTRLIEMCLMLYYRMQYEQMKSKPDTLDDADDDDVHNDENNAVETPQGWSDWAWSFVPQISNPEFSELDDTTQPLGDNSSTTLNAQLSPVLALGIYVEHGTASVKMHRSKSMPCLVLFGDGLTFELLSEGIRWTDVQLGVSYVKLEPHGGCLCGLSSNSSCVQKTILLSAGDSNLSRPLNFLSGSLFDEASLENQALTPEFVTDINRHSKLCTTEYGLTRFNAAWLNYLYHSWKSELIEGVDVEATSVSSRPYEQCKLQTVVGSISILLCDDLIHRLGRVLHCALFHGFTPYSFPDLSTDHESKTFSADEIPLHSAYLCTYVSNISYQFTVLDLSLTILPSTHPYYAITSAFPAGHHSLLSTSKGVIDKVLATSLGFQAPRCELHFNAPLYPGYVSRICSQIPSNAITKDNFDRLLYYCNSHWNLKVTDCYLQHNRHHLVAASSCFRLTEPISLKFHTKYLILPRVWKPHIVRPPVSSNVAELSPLHLNLRPKDFRALNAVLGSWCFRQPISRLHNLLKHSVVSSYEDSLLVLKFGAAAFEYTTPFVLSQEKAFATSFYVTSIDIGLCYSLGSQLRNVLSAPLRTSGASTKKFVALTFQSQVDDMPAVLLTEIERSVIEIHPFLLKWLQQCIPQETSSPLSSTLIRNDSLIDQHIAETTLPLLPTVNLENESALSTSEPKEQISFETSTKDSASVSVTSARTPAPTSPYAKTETTESESSKTAFGVMLVDFVIQFSKSNFIQISIAPADVLLYHGAEPDLVCQAFQVHLPSLSVRSNNFVSSVSCLHELPLLLPADCIDQSVSPSPCKIELQHAAACLKGWDDASKSIILAFPFDVSISLVVKPDSSVTRPKALSFCIHANCENISLQLSKFQVYPLLMFASTGLETFESLFLSLLPESQNAAPIQSANVDCSLNLPAEDGALLQSASTFPSFSLWFQFTLAKISLDLSGFNSDELKYTRLSATAEDVSFCADCQATFSKFTLKSGSTEVICEQHVKYVFDFCPICSKTDRCSSERSESDHSFCTVILFTSGDFFSRELTLRNLDDTCTPQFSKAFCSTDHHFLSVTFTRALLKSVRRRLRQLTCESDTSSTSSKLFFSKHREDNCISEFCITVEPCDVVFDPIVIPIVRDLLSRFAPDPMRLRRRQSHRATSNTDSAAESVTPVINNDMLPLFHLSADQFRLFIPLFSQHNNHNQHLVSASNRKYLLDTTYRDATLVLSVEQFCVSSQAENPISRVVLNQSLYQQSQMHDLLSQPGSGIEDRQYELHMKRLSLVLGRWTEMLNPQRVAKERLKELHITYCGQNPAAEWNCSEDLMAGAFVLNPIFSPFDLSLVFAPPAVIKLQEDSSADTVLGYSAELSANTDISVFLCCELMQAIIELFIQEMKIFTDSVTAYQEDVDCTKMSDSGFDTNSNNAGIGRSGATSQNAPAWDSLTSIISSLTAFEYLLTARNIDVFVFSFESSTIRPFLHFACRQPHTVLSRSDNIEKFEVSLYDFCAHGCLEEMSTIDNATCSCSLLVKSLQQPLLASRQGALDPKTWVPLSFFTAALRGPLTNPDFSLSFSRPMEILLQPFAIDNLVQFVQFWLNCIDHLALANSNIAPTHGYAPAERHQENFEKLSIFPYLPSQVHIDFSVTEFAILFTTKNKNIANELIFSLAELNLASDVNKSLSRNQVTFSAQVIQLFLTLKQAKPSTIKHLLRPVSDISLHGRFSELPDCAFVGLSVTISPVEFCIGMSTYIESMNILFKCLHSLSLLRVWPQTKSAERSGSHSFVGSQPHKQVFYDCLRSSDMAYVMQPTAELPAPNNIHFRINSGELLWGFPDLRRIVNLRCSPIPLLDSSPVEFEPEDSKAVTCILKYWNCATGVFTELLAFEISEVVDTRIFHEEFGENSNVASDIWCVEIQDSDPSSNSAGVSPFALVAALRVDFETCSWLTFDCMFHLNIPDVSLQILSTQTAAHYENYQLSNDFFQESAFLHFSVRDMMASSSFRFPSPVSACLSCTCSATILDPKYMALLPLLGSVAIKGKLEQKMTSDFQQTRQISVSVSKTKIIVTKYTFSAISSLYLSKHIPIPLLYVCNNTRKPVLISQPGQLLSPLKLDPMRYIALSWNLWSSSNNLDIQMPDHRPDGAISVSVNVPDIITFDKPVFEKYQKRSGVGPQILMTCFKKCSPHRLQVTISPCLLIINKLCETLHLEVDYVSPHGQFIETLAVEILGGSEIPGSTLVLEYLKEIRINMPGADATRFEFTSIVTSAHSLLRLVSRSGFSVIWCSVHTSSEGSTTITFSPLFVLYSYLPFDIDGALGRSDATLFPKFSIAGNGHRTDLHILCESYEDLILTLVSKDGDLNFAEKSNFLNLGCISRDVLQVSGDKKFSMSQSTPSGLILDSPGNNQNSIKTEGDLNVTAQFSLMWPAERTICITLKPYLVVDNKTFFDLNLYVSSEPVFLRRTSKTPVSNVSGKAWLSLRGPGVTEFLSGSFDLNLTTKPLTYSASYMANTPLYMNDVLPLEISCDGRSIIYLSLLLTTIDAVPQLVIRNRFSIKNSTEFPLDIMLFCSPSIDHTVTSFETLQFQSLSNNQSSSVDVSLCPFNFVQISPRTDSEIGVVLYLSLRVSCASGSIHRWSYPAKISTAFPTTQRVTLSCYCCSSSAVPLVVTNQAAGALQCLTVSTDQFPQLLIDNETPLELSIGQSLANVSTRITELDEPFETYPCAPSHHRMFFTFNTTNEMLTRKTTLGSHDNSNKVRLHFKVSDSNFSAGIDTSHASDRFIELDNGVYLFVRCAQPVGFTTSLTVRLAARLPPAAGDRVLTASSSERSITLSPVSPTPRVNKSVPPASFTSASSSHTAFPTGNSVYHSLDEYCAVLNIENIELCYVDLDYRLQESFVVHIFQLCLSFQEHSKKNSFLLSLEDLQVDNLIAPLQHHAFDVVLTTKRPSQNMNTICDSSQVAILVDITVNPNLALRDVALDFLKPFHCYLSDKFILDSFKFLEDFALSLPHIDAAPQSSNVFSQPWPNWKGLASPLYIHHLHIGAISLLVTAHCSIKVFLSIESSPLSLSPIRTSTLFICPEQFIQALSSHYVSSVIYNSGHLLTSLELLGNPSFFARSVSRGISDLFYLSIKGVTSGPTGFVSGVATGVFSFCKNITTGIYFVPLPVHQQCPFLQSPGRSRDSYSFLLGTLSSTSQLASSVSRNVDRLSFDSDYEEYQSKLRRSYSQTSLLSGMATGLNGFGVGLLGAVAGIADHPLRNVQEAARTGGTVTDYAAGVATGLMKGAIGLVTKPVAGAAGLVSETGKAILYSTGMVHLPQTIRPSSVLSSKDFVVSDFSLMLLYKRITEKSPSTCIFALTDTTTNESYDPRMPEILALTSTDLIHISHNFTHRVHPISSLDIQVSVSSTNAHHCRLEIFSKTGNLSQENDACVPPLKKRPEITQTTDLLTKFVNAEEVRDNAPKTLLYRINCMRHDGEIMRSYVRLLKGILTCDYFIEIQS